MNRFIIASLAALVLTGCDDPRHATQQQAMIQYAKVQKECERIVLGQDTLYKCQNPADTMLIKPYHAVQSTMGGSGHNSGASAYWDNDNKYAGWEAPFQIY